MQWFQKYLQRLQENRVKSRLDQRVKQVATDLFRQTFPKDQIRSVNIAERTDDYVVVGISYQSDFIPPPCRFFRVAPPSLSITKLSEDYRPPGWGPHR